MNYSLIKAKGKNKHTRWCKSHTPKHFTVCLYYVVVVVVHSVHHVQVCVNYFLFYSVLIKLKNVFDNSGAYCTFFGVVPPEFYFQNSLTNFVYAL